MSDPHDNPTTEPASNIPDVDALLSTLDGLGIAYRRVDHAPVFTCDEAAAALPDEPAIQTKNIFLRDKRGRRHLLLVTTCEKAVDIKRFTDTADADRLSFASPERLATHLGVQRGAVTVLGLLNDQAHAVELYVDREVWAAADWRCHPLVNTSTLVIARTALERLFSHTGHTPRIVPIAAV